MPGVLLVCARTRSVLSMSGRSGICSISLELTRTDIKFEAVSGFLRVDGLPMVRIQPDYDQRSVTSSSNVRFLFSVLRGVSILRCGLLRRFLFFALFSVVIIQLNHIHGIIR